MTSAHVFHYGTTISDSGFDGDNIFSIYFCAFPSHCISFFVSTEFTLVPFSRVPFSMLHAHRIEVKIYSETEIKGLNLSQFDIGRFKSYTCIKENLFSLLQDWITDELQKLNF